MPINKYNEYTKKFMWNTPDKKIHEASNSKKYGTNVNNPSAGATPSANFRQVGKSPVLNSNAKVQHLGDKKC